VRVAVVGLGAMGRSFATRALDRGHRVVVWNRSPGREAELVARGATVADSLPQAAGGVELVLVVLADDTAVLDVCLGKDGVVESLGPTTVLANVSTVAPDTVGRLAATGLEERFLDAPVMGSPDIVARGQCRFFIGGARSTVTMFEPLWLDLGAGYTHCGPVGAATTMKLVSNLQLIAGVASLAEGIATARAHGIPDHLIRRIFADSPVVSAASAVRLDSLMDVGHPGWFRPALAGKDLRLAIGLARDAGLGVRIGPAAEALLATVVADERQQWPDFSAVIEAL
jgi:3-hydroxyisobutyrate dehydrogenase